MENSLESILKFRKETFTWVTTSHTMTLDELNSLIKENLFNVFNEVRIVVKNGTEVTVTIPR